MNQQMFLAAAILAALLQPAHANPVPRQATITGVGGNGRCSIEVNVDGAAEVEVSGDSGLLTTMGGQPAEWRRFQCNVPLPQNPPDFRFVRINGRGTMGLIQDPRSTRGRAVIRINDPKGGRGVYAFDFQWRSSGGGPSAPAQGPWPSPGPGAFPMARAIRICQDAVTDWLNGNGYPYVTFERTIPDNTPGRHDWVTGTVNGKRRFAVDRFSFSCSVDFSSGRVRSVDVRRR